MKTREDIIQEMCLAFRPDYNTVREENPFMPAPGATENERQAIYNKMSYIFDNVISPSMTINNG